MPATSGDERDLVLGFLDWKRAAVLGTAGGLSDEQARWTPDGNLLPIAGVTSCQRPAGPAALVRATRTAEDDRLVACRYWLLDGDDAVGVQLTTSASGAALAADIATFESIAPTFRVTGT